MLGWQRALVVAVGMTVTNLVAANVLNPRFLKEGTNISFLEMILSVVVWGALLGFWGSILAIPLTLVLKKIAAAATPGAPPAASEACHADELGR